MRAEPGAGLPIFCPFFIHLQSVGAAGAARDLVMGGMETWIGLRYLRAKKRNGFMSFISLISIAGIALGVITLIVVLSVMNGFQRDVREQLYRVAPHMEIGFAEPDLEDPDGWKKLDRIARELPALKGEIVASMPYVAEQALFTHKGMVGGAVVQGVDPALYPDVAPRAEGGAGRGFFGSDNAPARGRAEPGGPAPIENGSESMLPPEPSGAKPGAPDGQDKQGGPGDEGEEGNEAAQETETAQAAKPGQSGQQGQPDYSLLREGAFNIVLGERLAQSLNAQVGEKISLLTPEGNATPAGMVPRLKQFKVVGLYRSDIYEVSSTLALINIRDAQRLYRYGNAVTGVRLRLAHPDKAPEMSLKIYGQGLPPNVWLTDWSDQNRTYFSAVSMEKKIMFVIMTLISAVASFNLVSSLVMTVNEKMADIAILRTIGMTPGGVMKVFLTQGAVSGFIGTAIGVALGVLIAENVGPIVSFIESMAGRKLIQSEVYFLNYIPSDVQFADVAIISGISLLLSFLATLYPAWKAARIEPAKALSYE